MKMPKYMATIIREAVTKNSSVGPVDGTFWAGWVEDGDGVGVAVGLDCGVGAGLGVGTTATGEGCGVGLIFWF
jgi:hypothetical protein